MTPERWQQIEQLYGAALPRPADERAPFLRAACAGDEELRHAVESLLAAHEEAGSFLQDNALAVQAAALVNELETAPAVPNFSHYEIVTRIGAGGMGEVWLARDTALDRKVALKLLPLQFTADADRLRRFVREAKAASALNHPNIITIYEIGQLQTEAGATHYIATEFIQGVTLRERLAGEKLPPPEALAIVLQITAALEAAHEAGIVHRDIKPENVMIRPDGLVKVLDFGLAKLSEPAASPVAEVNSQLPTRPVQTQPGMILGTPSYLAPEQARGLEVDARTDLFSLGVVLYEMLAGSRPFTGATPSDLIAAILMVEPPPLPNASAELQRIINQALQKDPGARYQTAKALAADLRKLQRRYETLDETDTIAPGQSLAAPTLSTAPALAAGTQPLPALGKSRARLTIFAIACAALLSVGAVIAYFNSRAQEIDSIAIMPLEYASGDAELEYLADGLTESLINNLSQLPKLRVLSRNAVFRYKGQQPDLEQVASQLKARAVVTGRIVRRGDRLDISLSLEDLRDHRQVWGNKYERGLSQLLALQASVASEISLSLRSRLSNAQQQQVARRFTEDDEAYRLYLQGLFHQHKLTEEGLNTSIKYFQQAIDKDGNYALAHAALANSYILIAAAFQPAETVIPLARQAAQRAVALDDTLAEGHAALAAVARSYDWDWEKAEAECRRALELNPNHAFAYNELGFLFLALGRTSDAIAAFQRRVEIEPNSLLAYHRLGRAYSFARQFDQALATFRKSLEFDPNHLRTHVTIGQIYGFQGKYAEAFAELDRAAALIKQNSDEADVMSVRAQLYARTGRTAEARQLLTRLLAYPNFVRPHTIALVYVALGDNDRALEWLEKAAQDRAPYLADIKINPSFDGLHNDPRLQALLNRLNQRVSKRTQ